MNLETETQGDVTVVIPRLNNLDASNALAFKEAVAPMIAKTPKIVLDLETVQFIDSSGCGALLSALRQLNQAGGDLRLCSVQRPVMGLFKLIRMHRIVDIFDSRADAIASF